MSKKTYAVVTSASRVPGRMHKGGNLSAGICQRDTLQDENDRFEKQESFSDIFASKAKEYLKDEEISLMSPVKDNNRTFFQMVSQIKTLQPEEKPFDWREQLPKKRDSSPSSMGLRHQMTQEGIAQRMEHNSYFRPI